MGGRPSPCNSRPTVYSSTYYQLGFVRPTKRPRLDLLQRIVPALTKRGTMNVRREEAHGRFDTRIERRLSFPLYWVHMRRREFGRSLDH